MLRKIKLLKPRSEGAGDKPCPHCGLAVKCYDAVCELCYFDSVRCRLLSYATSTLARHDRPYVNI